MVMTVDDDRSAPTPSFEFTAGALCLDFTNTVNNRGADEPRDLLHGFPELVAWFEQAGLLDPPAATAFRGWGARRPSEAAALVRRARALREGIYSVFSAAAQARPPDPA